MQGPEKEPVGYAGDRAAPSGLPTYSVTDAELLKKHRASMLGEGAINT
jgi:hypothetical protein